jgi:hypothetical protein
VQISLHQQEFGPVHLKILKVAAVRRSPMLDIASVSGTVRLRPGHPNFAAKGWDEAAVMLQQEYLGRWPVGNLGLLRFNSLT